MPGELFQGFGRVWTAVTLSRRVRKKPVAVKVAGERLVLFRRPSGELAGLLDRCPHRGVALSLGRVTDEGCLQCPFHGWEIDGRGQVTHAPLNPDARLDLLRGWAFPVQEAAGLVFVFTGVVDAESAEGPPPLVLPEGLRRSDVARTYLELEWRCHWTRAMENMLDMPHVPFVHRTTIGRGMAPLLTRSSRMDVQWEETAYGGVITSTLDGRDSEGRLDFYRPNLMELHIDPPGKLFRMHAFCVPVDDEHTRMIIVGARSFLRARVLNPLFGYSNRVIAGQDRAVVESSSPAIVPDAAEEHSVASDRPTLQFRKYYRRCLKGSSAHRPTPPPAATRLTLAPNARAAS